jgi:predicted nucleotide-binding protein
MIFSLRGGLPLNLNCLGDIKIPFRIADCLNAPETLSSTATANTATVVDVTSGEDSISFALLKHFLRRWTNFLVPVLR